MAISLSTDCKAPLDTVTCPWGWIMENDQKRTRKPLIRGRTPTLAAIVAVIAATAVGNVVGRIGGGAVADGVRATTPTAEIEAELDRVATDGGNTTLAATKRLFPDEFADFRGTMAARVKSRASQKQVNEAAFEWMRKFTVLHLDDAASAPPEYLVRLTEAHVAMLTILQREDPQACADFGMTGFKASTVFSPAATVAIDAVSTRQVEAARAGIDHPIKRPADLPDTGWSALADRMVANGASERTIAALADLSKQPVNVQCDATLHLYKAAASLPAEPAAHAAAAFLLMAKGAPR